MCGTPYALSRTIVTSSRGCSVEATPSGATPKRASLKSASSVAPVNGRATRSSCAYMPSWSSLCAGRAPVVKNAPSSSALDSPLAPGGSTLRTPPASLAPSGPGAGGAACAAGATSARARIASAVGRTARTYRQLRCDCGSELVQQPRPPAVVVGARGGGEAAVHEAHERGVALRLERDLDGARPDRRVEVGLLPAERVDHPRREVDFDELAADVELAAGALATHRPVHLVEHAAGSRVGRGRHARPARELLGLGEEAEDRLRARRDAHLAHDRLSCHGLGHGACSSRLSPPRDAASRAARPRTPPGTRARPADPRPARGTGGASPRAARRAARPRAARAGAARSPGASRRRTRRRWRPRGARRPAPGAGCRGGAGRRWPR